MMRAMWNCTVIAEAPLTVVVEGNRSFPPESLRREYFVECRTKSLCFWKGIARYYDVSVGGQTNPDAAWYYPKPSPLARRIKSHAAFRQGVVVEGTPEPTRRGKAGVDAVEGGAGRRCPASQRPAQELRAGPLGGLVPRPTEIAVTVMTSAAQATRPAARTVRLGSRHRVSQVQNAASATGVPSRRSLRGVSA
ncbi:DUF427 domain-containing protein [Streptomyces sp. NPDC058486]|uniref:DUF427 domain-containing protein n=1 Tax=unclassified Streptomyces TaxID=2593676 RepID=UPI00364CFEF6